MQALLLALSQTGFIWILLACALYGVIHSVLASTTLKAWAERQAGPGAYRRFYRLFFVAVALITSLPLLALAGLLPDRLIYAIPAPWLWLTLSLQALALMLLMVGVLQTGALTFVGIRQLFESAHPGGPVPEKLVVNGLYRWVRHPLYTASFVLLWLAPRMTWNLLALAIGLSAYMLIGTLFEEQKLVQQFGKDYLDYRRRTPRVIPGIKLT